MYIFNLFSFIHFFFKGVGSGDWWWGGGGGGGDTVAQEETGSHFESIAEVGEVQEIPGPVSEDMLEMTRLE